MNEANYQVGLLPDSRGHIGYEYPGTGNPVLASTQGTRTGRSPARSSSYLMVNFNRELNLLPEFLAAAIAQR